MGIKHFRAQLVVEDSCPVLGVLGLALMQRLVIAFWHLLRRVDRLLSIFILKDCDPWLVGEYLRTWTTKLCVIVDGF